MNAATDEMTWLWTHDLLIYPDFPKEKPSDDFMLCRGLHANSPKVSSPHQRRPKTLGLPQDLAPPSIQQFKHHLSLLSPHQGHKIAIIYINKIALIKVAIK